MMISERPIITWASKSFSSCICSKKLHFIPLAVFTINWMHLTICITIFKKSTPWCLLQFPRDSIKIRAEHIGTLLSTAITAVNYSVWPIATIPFHRVIRTTRIPCTSAMDLISLASYWTNNINSPLQKTFINGQKIYEVSQYFQARISYQ